MAKAKSKFTRNDDPARLVDSDYDPIDRFEREPGGRLYEPPTASPPAPASKKKHRKTKQGSRAGAPEEHDWEEGKLFAMQLLETRGNPLDKADQTKGWKTKTDVAKLVRKHLGDLSKDKDYVPPDMSTTRGKVSDWIKEFEGKPS